jgi:restriction system protein
MTLWLVRAGSRGEQEQGALQNNIVTIGWNEIPDVSRIESKEELRDLYLRINPNAKRMRVTRMVGQIWDFAKQIKKGDLVALPLKMQSAIALGRVEGDYEFKEIITGIKHIRPVKWLQILPRTRFDQDLLFSLGAFTTVCRISRNDAENRIEKLLDNISRKEVTAITPKTENSDIDESSDVSSILDTEQNAKDMIIRYIEKTFVGHDMVRLVEALLKS